LSKRVTRNIEPESFLLVFELQTLGPGLGWIKALRLIGAAKHHSKQTSLPDFLFSLFTLPPIHGAIDVGVQERPILIEPVERTGFDETFNNSLVHRTQVGSLTKIEERLERLVCDDRGDGGFADILDGCQSESNTARSRGKVHVAGIDVR